MTIEGLVPTVGLLCDILVKSSCCRLQTHSLLNSSSPVCDAFVHTVFQAKEYIYTVQLMDVILCAILKDSYHSKRSNRQTEYEHDNN